MAYFDNAATTYPKPEEVYNYMNEFYRHSGASVGRGNYAIAQCSNRLVAETRNLIKEILRCPAKQVIFTPTATIALNVIIQGLIRLGIKNVYISPFEHNAVTRTLYASEKNGLIHVFNLSVSEDLKYDFERIKYQFETNKPDLVVVSHVSNVIGLISPVEKIFEYAKMFNAFTLADMSQSAGLVDTNVGLTTFDFAVFAGHKTLYGPTGISGFVMEPKILLPSILYGGTGTESANQDMPTNLPDRFEMGTLNISGIAGLYASLKWIKEKGINNIAKREEENRKILLNLLNDFSYIKVVGDSSDNKYVGIVSCLINGISSDSASLIFNEKGIDVRTGLQCAPLAHKFIGTYPTGTVRFSVGYFTNEKDFGELRNALEYINENI